MILLRLPILALLSFFSLHHPIFTSAAPNCPTAYQYSPLDNTPDVNCRCLDPPAAVSPPPAPISSPTKPRKSVLLPFGRVNGIATVVILVITLLNIVVYNLRQLQETNAVENLIIPSSPSLPSEQLCRRFSLAEILSATHNFDESLVIGQGGFGKVYKGVIDNGASTVAIKRLHSMSKQGAPEFWTEIAMLSKFRHSHLVSLIGYCDNYSEMILVYEYMVRGTIANHLHKIGKHSTNNDSLTWVQRLKICIGAARGLDYLHTGTGIRHRVIHRDVKTSNILLDENMEAKISDFGMSKIGPANQSCTHVSTNVRGTYGYVDPEYFLTRRLTRKSDVYAFGVVLFEVLCGRPAVDLRLREEQRGLADWAQQCIKEGTLDQIIDPSLRGQILSNCMSAFVQIANQCLHARPKKRPTMAEVVAWLEFVLSLQEREHSSIVDEEIFNAGAIFDIHVNADSVVKREVVNAGSGKSGDEKINEIAPLGDEGGGQSSVKSAKKMTFSKKVRLFFSVTARAISEKVRRLPRNTRPEPTTNLPTTNKPSEPVGNDAKPSRKHNNNNNNVGNSALPNKHGGVVQLAPVAQRVVPKPVHGDAKPIKNGKINNNMDGNVELLDKGVVVVKEVVPSGQIVTPELKMFTFAELKIATMNFRPDMVLGEGGFGRVFKGWVDEKTYAPSKVGIGIAIAVKKFNPEGLQGFKEWQSEVQFLGTFRHPNLVKLLGYCWEDKEFLLVYEFMEKGSLEKHLFKKRAEPLPWDTRIKIAIGAARGLYFLHTSEKQVIYRDFKSSNILLNGDFSAKLSDFGLAKLGPVNDGSHVTTGVMGTYGYAAPEYIATGHLYPKSDVYSFGVVLLEILTGLRVLDVNRPSGKHNLVEWAKPFLSDRRKLERVMDPRLEHEYPTKAAFRSAVLVQNCLQSDPKNRPSTEEVLIALENISAIKMKPKENPEANGRHPMPQRQE